MSKNPIKNTAVCFVVLLALFSIGCTQKKVEAEVITYSIQLWVPLVLIAGSVGVAVGGFLLKRNSLYGWILLIGGPACLVVVVPGLFIEKLSISSEEIHLRSGIWAMSARCDILLNEVKEVSLTKRISRGRRGRKRTSHTYTFVKKDGTTIKMPHGTLVKAGIADIKAAIRAHSIPIIDNT